jgi:hypothetical protein
MTIEELDKKIQDNYNKFDRNKTGKKFIVRDNEEVECIRVEYGLKFTIKEVGYNDNDIEFYIPNNKIRGFVSFLEDVYSDGYPDCEKYEKKKLLNGDEN